jgi:hypothetical protein
MEAGHRGTRRASVRIIPGGRTILHLQRRPVPAARLMIRLAGIRRHRILFPQANSRHPAGGRGNVALQKGGRRGMVWHCFQLDSLSLNALKFTDGKRKDRLIEKTITL